MAIAIIIHCLGCGKDMTTESTNRYNVLGPACEKVGDVADEGVDMHTSEATSG